MKKLILLTVLICMLTCCKKKKDDPKPPVDTDYAGVYYGTKITRYNDGLELASEDSLRITKGDSATKFVVYFYNPADTLQAKEQYPYITLTPKTKTVVTCNVTTSGGISKSDKDISLNIVYTYAGMNCSTSRITALSGTLKKK